MKNKLTANIGLKLASILFAIILWLIVTSVDNPITSNPYYNIPVTLINTELITDSGQVYEVLDGTDIISRVSVRAPHSVISELSASNIIATADVSDLSSLDTISIKLSTDIYGDQINSITGSIDTVKLRIENKISKPLALKATVSGQVESGYMVGDVTTDQNLVRIEGPESVINKVVKAAVDVNVSGITSDIGTNAEIKLYDAEDNIVASKSITQNIRNVGVKVSIWKTTEVPVNFSYSGTPAPGYQATGVIESSSQTVVIAGKYSLVKNIVGIEIPSETLDITEAQENLVKEIDIRDYLPDNVYLVDPNTAKITATVGVEAETSKRLEIREEKVKITNIPEGYDASISGLEESFIVVIIGLSKDIATLQAANINGEVDIAQWMEQQGMTVPEPGFYTVDVDFGLADGVRILEPVTVTLHISEAEE